MDKKEYLKPIIEEEEILIEDICLASTQDEGIGAADYEDFWNE